MSNCRETGFPCPIECKLRGCVANTRGGRIGNSADSQISARSLDGTREMEEPIEKPTIDKRLLPNSKQ